jgi:predicted N-acetyltransferase YhbS
MQTATSTVHYRIATEADVPALHALDAASAPVDAIDGHELYVLANPETVRFFLECKGLLVAELDAEIVGYVLTHLVEHMHGAERLVWIEHIGVHPSFRRQGIGLGLFGYLREHYKGRAPTLHASVHPQNRASLALMQALQAECVERVLVYAPV